MSATNRLGRINFHRMMLGVRLVLWLTAGLLSLWTPWSAMVWVGFSILLVWGVSTWATPQRLSRGNRWLIPVEFILVAWAVHASGGLASPWFLFFGAQALFITAYGTFWWSVAGAVAMIGLYGWAVGPQWNTVLWVGRIVLLSIYFVASGLMGNVIQWGSQKIRSDRRVFEHMAQLKVVQESIIEEQDLSTVLTAVLTQAIQIVTEVSTAYVALINDHYHRLESMAVVSKSATDGDGDDRVLQLLPNITIPENFEIVDLAPIADNDFVRSLIDHGSHFGAVVPLRDGNTTVGLAVFCGTSSDQLKAQEPVFDLLGSIIYSQVRFHRERERGNHRRELLKIFEQVGRLLNRNLDIGAFLADLHRAVSSILEVDAFAVVLAIPDDPSHALMRYLYDDGKTYPQEVFELGESSITRRVFSTGKSQLLTPVPQEIPTMGAERQPLSLMAVPLIDEGRIIGVMHAQSYRRAYTQEQMDFFSAIASQASMALRNAQLYQKTQEIALTDPLTGLGNARQFSLVIEDECARSASLKTPLSLLLIDSDSLKSINDHYGHMAGDAHLQRLAQAIRQSVRDGDTACRYAGDEFVIILPASHIDDALAIGERIRGAMDQTFSWEGNLTVMTTISVGAAEYMPGMTPDELFAQADHAMYEAKQLGKNRVIAR